MAVKVHNATWWMLALAPLVAVSGCCCLAIPLPGENQCPTDARRLYCSCGEEAVRRCPCGPDSQFYGLKPTCWREWPEGWHCNGCEGMPYVDHELCGEPVAESPTNTEPMAEEPAPEEVDFSNPFRGKPGAVELPLPPDTSQVAPAPSTSAVPSKTTPVQIVPLQPEPTAPPALEKPPSETTPTKEAPTPTAPPANKSTTEKPARDATIVAAAPPSAPAATAPTAPIIQAEAKVPNLLPDIPAAMKMPAAAPILIAPLNAPTTMASEKSEPNPVQVAEVPKVEKKKAEKPTLQWSEARKVNDRAEDPTLSDRVERHLINNLSL